MFSSAFMTSILKSCKTNSSRWQFQLLYSKDIHFCFYGFWTGCMLTHRLLYKTKWTTWTNTLLLDSRLQGTPSRWVPCITWAIEMFVDTLKSFFFCQTGRNTCKHWMLSYIYGYSIRWIHHSSIDDSAVINKKCH